MSKSNINRFILFFLLAIIISVIVFFIYRHNLSLTKQNDFSAKAQSQNNILTSDDDWNLGTKNNITASSGNITINDKTLTLGAEISLVGAVATADPDTGKSYVIDGLSCTTRWAFGNNYYSYWKVDLGETKTFITDKCSGHPTLGTCESTGQRKEEYSVNGTDWLDIPASLNDTDFSCLPPGPGACGGGKKSEVITARYLRYSVDTCASASDYSICELKIYDPPTAVATATHTSGSTQITNTDLYQWQTFTPTYTKPANTDISFKFRSSTDHTTWTSWTTAQTVASGSPLDITSLVTSKTGDPGSETFYKYIQVEATLTSSDGVSTPTLSDYTIGYHTNVKPNAPTAASVTIGS